MGSLEGAGQRGGMEPVDDRGLLQEQIIYYRSRAPTYDVTSALPGDRLAAYGAELEAKLRSLGWEVEVHTAGPFLWAAGTPRARLAD
ncbi:MAG: hypothetical protein H0V60_00915 [Actinobacteria bacterium]|nr:hypothetical protein [Actinomycetota bacterium]